MRRENKIGKIKIESCFVGNTEIEGLKVITPSKYEDERGYFLESYNQKDMFDNGLYMKFVQDNQSMSYKGVLRGLHYQKKHPQGKLVRVIYGNAFDVVVDIRLSSNTYGKWYGVELSGENNKQFYIPDGFAHGFLVLSDKVVFLYKCTDFYYPNDEGGILWCDQSIDIKWPIENNMNLVISEKDRNWLHFAELNI